MAVTTTKTNKPINPRGNDQSPKGYNRAALYSGKALSFDGVNDYVDCGTLDVTGYTQMSVSFYMNVDTTTQDFRLISIRYSGADDIRIFHSVSIGGGVLNFSLDDGDVDNIGVNFETNQWYHVVMTHDGATLKAYFNGVEQASTASTFDYANADGLFYVGRYTGGVVTYYDGEASNVKIFNTALTAAQVSDLYNNPEKIVPTGVEDTALKLWLPMMEGAGTTAYDGSGNGNHGTISGATYVHGVGAPVSQTAVIDWNKGTNLLTYSEQIDNTAYTTGGGSGHSVIVTANHGTAPDGTQTADRVQITRGTSYAELFQRTTANMVVGEDYVLSFYAKSLSGTPTLYTAWNDDYLNEVTFTTDWVRYEYQYQYISHIQGSGLNLVTWTSLPTTSTTADLLIWGVQLEKASNLGAYIPNHTNTAITTPVLLPQGLTSGRDITGVNLFENVRKQGALNLDGNSWAEVHDNASLDITDAVSLEMWIYWEDQSAETTILGKWVGGADRAYALIATTTTGRVDFRQRVSSTTYTMGISTLSNGWNHLVATHDHSANERLGYINGVLVSTATSQGVSNESDNNITIGGISTTQYTNDIAQPRIYNRALTAEEVQRNYNAGKNIYK